MRILVTGGAGFIGSHIVEHFQGQAEVVVLDNFRSGHRRNLAGLELREPKASVEDSGAAADGLSVVTNPLLLENCLKGWANAIGETPN